MRSGRAMLSLVTLFLLICTTYTRFVNVTIDDYYGDSMQHRRPNYYGFANLGDQSVGMNNCTTGINCSIQPNASLSFDRTWSTAMYNAQPGATANITFPFQGVSIWVFFILANSNGTATSECNFTLDGNLLGSFSHQPNSSASALQYNVSVFNATGLKNTRHDLVITASPNSNTSYITFDYAIYTADVLDNSTGSSSTTSATSATQRPSEVHRPPPKIKSGIIIGSLVSVALTSVLIFLLFRQCRKENEQIVTPIAFVQPTRSNNDDIATDSTHLPSEFPVHLVPVRREYKQQDAPITKSRDDVRAERQREIDQRLQVVQQEMHQLARRQNSVRTNRPDSVFSSAEVTETEEDLEGIRGQMSQLWAQIAQLEMERSSDWAQGLSDGSPPEYYSEVLHQDAILPFVV